MFTRRVLAHALPTVKSCGTKLSFTGVLGVIFSILGSQAATATSKAFHESVESFSQASARGVQVMGTPKSVELVEFQVALKMRNFPDLEDRIAAGEIISEAEMVDKYYPTATDYQSVNQWLTKQGLTLRQTYPNHLSVEVEGSVSQVQQALGVGFQAVSFEGRRYLSTFSAPTLPQDVAKIVLSTNHLQQYQHAYPHHTSNNASSSDLNPQISVAPYLVNEIKSAYNATALTQFGTNQKTAILIDAFPLNSDLTLFWLVNSVPQSLSNIEEVPVVTGIPATSEEGTLDVEWSSSIAPASRVRIYATGDLSLANIDKGYQAIITDLPNQPTLHQLSISFGGCESDNSPSQLQTDRQFLATIASKGVTIFVSSGDSGGNCSPNSRGSRGIVGVSYPASDQFVTAVGGTSLNAPNPTNVANLGSETAWTGSGGGVSKAFCAPGWQPDYTQTCQYGRLVPDVALDADPVTGAYLVFQGQRITIGGTSLSAPVWAGFNALINEARASTNKQPLGLLGPRIYNLLQTSNFRDITSGCNTLGTTTYNCAGTGYDLVTGIGVPRMDTLLPTLVSQP